MNHQEGAPCRHMESLLQQVADGSITGIRKFYALAHAARCHRCGTFLGRMKATLELMHASRQTGNPEDVMDRLRAMVRELDSETS